MKIVSLAYCVSTRSRRAHLRRRPARLFVWAAAPWVALLVVGGLPSSTYAATVPLGTSESFAVLAGSTVTNTGPSVISGDLGVSPGTAVTGFPPGMLAPGTVHAADAVALQAQTDLTIAYKNAFGRTGGGAISAPLGGGTTLFAGVYTSAADIFVGGDLTLDGGGDPNALFVFQAKTGTLITAAGTTSGVPNTRVLLRNGAQACNVFWQVGSSATIETSTQFAGNILALTSITLKTGATLYGRALARNGAVTLDTNRITKATCATVAASPPSIASTSATTGAGQPVTVSLLGTDATGAPLTYSVAVARPTERSARSIRARAPSYTPLAPAIPDPTASPIRSPAATAPRRPPPPTSRSPRPATGPRPARQEAGPRPEPQPLPARRVPGPRLEPQPRPAPGPRPALAARLARPRPGQLPTQAVRLGVPPPRLVRPRPHQSFPSLASTSYGPSWAASRCCWQAPWCDALALVLARSPEPTRGDNPYEVDLRSRAWVQLRTPNPWSSLQQSTGCCTQSTAIGQASAVPGACRRRNVTGSRWLVKGVRILRLAHEAL